MTEFRAAVEMEILFALVVLCFTSIATSVQLVSAVPAATQDTNVKDFKDLAFAFLGSYEHRDPETNEISRIKRYYLSKLFKGDWMTAYSFCLSVYMEMATLEDENTAEHFLSMLSTKVLRFDHPGAYIGGISGTPLSRSDWYFINQGIGTRATFAMKFNTGEPNNVNGAEFCLEASVHGGSFGFNDAPCYHHQSQDHFICQEIEYL